MKDQLRRYGVLVAFVAMMASYTPATAGGVALTLTPSASSTSPQEVTLTWTASGDYATGTTVVVSATSAFTAIANCATPDNDLNNDGNYDGSFTSLTPGTATYTFTSSTMADLTMSACLQFTFPGTATNYSVSFLSSNPVDFGAALFYANGGNQVNVTATVPSSLSFSIRNADDTAYTNSCALGNLSLASTSTCAYRLRIATNAANGFLARIQANQNLGTGMATLTNVTDDGAQPVVGSELYGITLVQAATEGGRSSSTLLFTLPASENDPAGFTFNVDPTPVPTAAPQNFISHGAAFQTGPMPSSVTTTSFVEHGASITAGTAAGNYSQVVTYTVTGSF